MSILLLNKLALDLVAKDFSDGHTPTNGGPTKTSRALAIIHQAAADAYFSLAPIAGRTIKLPTIPGTPTGVTAGDASTAMLAAGIEACRQLYPDFVDFINTQSSAFGSGGSGVAKYFGTTVAKAWIKYRADDASDLPQTDTHFNSHVGAHRPDPLDPKQITLGRNWGLVRPFVLANVEKEAWLKPPFELGSPEYKCDFDGVYKNGRANITTGDDALRTMAITGIFWGYDGANKLGTPPRLYNQVITATDAFGSLSEADKINALAAVNVAMADAGIAAWFWKYRYDRWRPVVGIREGAAGWGVSGIGDGLGNAPDPFWLPLGAPASNETVKQNGTPPFPAYPSGHASFGTACFETFAALAGKTVDTVRVKDFVSDEFNGETTDNRGVTRPKFRHSFTLAKAIEENKVSRVGLGVHWKDDSDGGEIVGKAIACLVAKAYGAPSSAPCPAPAASRAGSIKS